MSRALLRDAVGPLPSALRDDVLSYASFVEEVAYDRGLDLGVELTRDQRDRVVFIAGVIHLREILGGQLAIVEAATGRNPEYTATENVRGLRVGRDELRRNSGYVRRLRTVRAEMNELLLSAGVSSSASRLADAINVVAATNSHD